MTDQLVRQMELGRYFPTTADIDASNRAVLGLLIGHQAVRFRSEVQDLYPDKFYDEGYLELSELAPASEEARELLDRGWQYGAFNAELSTNPQSVFDAEGLEGQAAMQLAEDVSKHVGFNGKLVLLQPVYSRTSEFEDRDIKLPDFAKTAICLAAVVDSNLKGKLFILEDVKYGYNFEDFPSQRHKEELDPKKVSSEEWQLINDLQGVLESKAQQALIEALDSADPSS